jgi:hypothetical protein
MTLSTVNSTTLTRFVVDSAGQVLDLAEAEAAAEAADGESVDVVETEDLEAGA